MATIKFTRFKGFLKDLSGGSAEQYRLFLIFGENYIVKQFTQKLKTFLLDQDAGSFASETLEGGSISMGDVIEEMTTLSFFSAKKLVILRNAPLFSSQDKSVDIAFNAADIEHLSDVLEKGLPDNHYLIITAPAADKRKKIYKTIEKHGVCIDCAVAQGMRKADQDEQNRVLLGVANQLLAKVGKTIDPQAFKLLAAQTGFNLDLLRQNLDKLTAYSGKRTVVEPADVLAVVNRDRKDPIFNLTNALMEKNAELALFYFGSLLKDGYHHLQILKSFENQFRKLLLVKAFINALQSQSPLKMRGISFNQFKQSILPKVVQGDLRTTGMLEEQQVKLSTDESDKKKKHNFTDLLLAPNPKNAYPVFQTFQKSENFSLTECRDILLFLSELDLRLKTSSFEINTAVEHFILTVCNKGGFVYATQDQNHRHRF